MTSFFQFLSFKFNWTNNFHIEDLHFPVKRTHYRFEHHPSGLKEIEICSPNLNVVGCLTVQHKTARAKLVAAHYKSQGISKYQHKPMLSSCMIFISNVSEWIVFSIVVLKSHCFWTINQDIVRCCDLINLFLTNALWRTMLERTDFNMLLENYVFRVSFILVHNKCRK